MPGTGGPANKVVLTSDVPMAGLKQEQDGLTPPATTGPTPVWAEAIPPKSTRGTPISTIGRIMSANNAADKIPQTKSFQVRR